MSTVSMLDLPHRQHHPAVEGRATQETVPSSLSQPMAPNLWRVRSFHRETYDTFTLLLRPMDRTRLLPYAPGQFNMLYVFGQGEVPISISGDASEPHQLIHTIRAVGPVTKSLAQIRPDDVVGVRGPFGTAWPVEEAKGRDVVFVAGGIGLAPLRPAIYHVLEHRHDYGRVTLLYGARTPRDLLYGREVERWRGRLDVEVDVTVDAAPEDWHGNVGLVTEIMPKAQFDPANTTAMIVGPEIMMRFVILEFLRRGVPESDIFLSMERNMKCGLGYCGHCQYGPLFICKDGPVFSYERLAPLLQIREL